MRQPINNLIHAYSPRGDVTQYFAENPTLYAHLDLAGHNGIDYVRPHGELMYAIEDAWVVEVRDDAGGFGKHLRLISKNADENGFHREWTYGHNSHNLVKQNDEVKAGQGIAMMGNTGFVVSGHTPFWSNNPYRGTHLHLGLRLVRLLKSGGWSYAGNNLRIQVQNANNGYKGAIDPLPYMLRAERIETNSAIREAQLTVIGLLNKLLNQLR
jgi:murein DD-endopeptidase MepM/ murein hydrolase activator NlpD